MHEISIREYGVLLNRRVDRESLELAGIESKTAWEFFEQLAYSNQPKDRFIEVTAYGGEKALRVINFVGVVTAPDGTQIEILPKTSDLQQEIQDTRALLWQMLCTVQSIPLLETTQAQLMLRNQRLPEAMISIFLDHMAILVRRGIRKDYERIEAEERFLKGRLRVAQQMRQPPHRLHLFQIEYDVLSENRPENRLLHAALHRVLTYSRSPTNQHQARELLRAFDTVPVSSDYPADFQRWRHGRDMAHYRPVLPWTRFILNEQSPFALKDQHLGISFLFPMEKLFEKYVAKVLATQLADAGLRVKEQLSHEYVSTAPQRFRMKPDIGVYRDKKLIGILDTKWKLIDQVPSDTDGDEDAHAPIQQADVYQLYTYGRKYLNGKGPLILIYPHWAKFPSVPLRYQLDDELILHAVSFNLQSNTCLALSLLESASVPPSI